MVILSPSCQNSSGSDLSWVEWLSAPAGLFLYGLPQDLWCVFYLELLSFGWLHCILIFSCQLIHRQHSPSTVCTLWGEKMGIHGVLSVVLINALQPHLLWWQTQRAWRCSMEPEPVGLNSHSPNQDGCMQTVPCARSLTPRGRAGSATRLPQGSTKGKQRELH